MRKDFSHKDSFSSNEIKTLNPTDFKLNSNWIKYIKHLWRNFENLTLLR